MARHEGVAIVGDLPLEKCGRPTQPHQVYRVLARVLQSSLQVEFDSECELRINRHDADVDVAARVVCTPRHRSEQHRQTQRSALTQPAADLTGLSLSDYVRSRIVRIAERDMEEAETGVLRLRREDQISFWRALQSPPKPTRAQRALGALVRSVT